MTLGQGALLPTLVDVPTVQPTQLPNQAGGCVVANLAPPGGGSVDLARSQYFEPGSLTTLQPGFSTEVVGSLPLWCRVSPGQSPMPSSVTVLVTPGAGAIATAVNIANEVNVAGNVTATISGTADVNVTNASIPVSGSVSADITNASLTIAGTVDIAAGQLVQVENPSGGSLTVAGTVDINSVTGIVTIDANGSDISVDQVPQGKLIATIPAATTQYLIAAATIGNANTLTFLGENSDLLVLSSILQSAVPNYAIPFGQVRVPGSSVIVAVIADLPDGSEVTVEFSAATAAEVLVYGSAGIDSVVASVSNLPLIAGGAEYTPQLVAVSANIPLQAAVASGTSFNWETADGGTLLIWTNAIGITSVVDSAGANWPFRLVAMSSTMWCFAIPLSGTAADGFSAAHWTVNFAAAISGWYAWVQGAPYLPPSQPLQVTVPQPAAGANWSYTLPFPARVRHIGAVFTASATAATRYPYVNINPGSPAGNGFDALPNGQGMTAGGAYYLSWQAGSGFVPYLSLGANQWQAAIPDYGVLPTGTVIGSGVLALQAGDQWGSTNLQLEPA